MLNKQLSKNKFNYSILIIISLILLMSESMRLYFTWELPTSIICFNAFIFCLLYMLSHPYSYGNIFKRLIAPVILLVVTYFYELVFVIDGSVAVVVVLFKSFCAVFLLLSPEVIHLKLFKWFTNFIAIITAISLFAWVLFLLGFSFPNYYKEIDIYYTHTVYYLFLLRGIPGTDLIPRFCGMFLEPGHVATTCCFLLYLNEFNFKKIQNIIFLLAILFSLSLAGYGLLIGGIALYLFLNQRKKILPFLLFVVLVLAVVGISLNYNRGDNILNNSVFSRLEMENGDIVGNNRTTKDFDRVFKRYVKSNEIVLGKGRDVFSTRASSTMIFGCATWKRYLYVRGIVGTMLLLLFLIVYLYKEWSPLSLGFFILFVVGNMIRDYPLKELWLYLYIVGIPYCRKLKLLNNERMVI